MLLFYCRSVNKKFNNFHINFILCEFLLIYQIYSSTYTIIIKGLLSQKVAMVLYSMILYSYL